MLRFSEQTINPSSGHNPLETADAVARAAHLWIRSLCLGDHYEANERQCIAGGLVAGLCERLELDPRAEGMLGWQHAEHTARSSTAKLAELTTLRPLSQE